MNFEIRHNLRPCKLEKVRAYCPNIFILCYACSFFPQSFPIIESRKEPIAMQNYWNVSDNGLSSICGLKDLACLKNASSTLKSLYYASLADVEVMQLLQKKGIDCNCPAGDIQSSIIHTFILLFEYYDLKTLFKLCLILYFGFKKEWGRSHAAFANCKRKEYRLPLSCRWH